MSGQRFDLHEPFVVSGVIQGDEQATMWVLQTRSPAGLEDCADRVEPEPLENLL